MQFLDAFATAKALAWPALIAAIETTIRDTRAGEVTSPPRMSLPITDDAVWLLMPAWSSRADIAACKLITVHPDNSRRGLPTIQGDILVIRASTGERLALLDGPTVTARRTAAVTVLAIKRIRQARREGRESRESRDSAKRHARAVTAAPDTAVALDAGHDAADAEATSCLIIGCGVQGRSHLEAIHATFPATQFLLHSRTVQSATQLAQHAAAKGISARVVAEPRAVLSAVDIVACCTPALQICLHHSPPEGAIIAAIGSFKPEMSEIAPDVMQAIDRNILLDTEDARHEAGELIQAGIVAEGLPTLLSWNERALPAIARTVLFKSCGSALWDLAAAQAAVNSPDSTVS